MYIFKVWKNYNEFCSKLYLYDLTLVFESLFKKYSKNDSCSSSVFTVFVIVIGSRLWGDENEFKKTKRYFCPQPTHSQKPLSFLQQLLSFERFEFIFVAYFQGLNYLIISCFSHKFAEHIPINWRGILKNQERFLFITY